MHEKDNTQNFEEIQQSYDTKDEKITISEQDQQEVNSLPLDFGKRKLNVFK